MSANTFYVIFKIDQQLFAIRLSEVFRIVRVVQITSIPEVPEVIEGVINVQGDIIPVVNLRKRFGLNAGELDLDAQIILINSKDRMLGLLADEVIDILESQEGDIISQKKLLPGADRIQGFIKNEENMILIQDIETLLTINEEKKLEKSLKKSKKTIK
ncbi:purine-binding chemotaxis protein CheW [candidate division KSB1 bacterium]|nr:purine-binding chemotaxis protein CheW [candidate division KSB1 bacterium]